MEEMVLENSILGRETSARYIPTVKTAKTNFAKAEDYSSLTRIVEDSVVYEYQGDISNYPQTTLSNRNLVDILVRTNTELKKEEKLLSTSIDVSRVRQVAFGAISELYLQGPKKIFTEVTYDDSVYITSIFGDFNMYLEIIFEDEEETYLFSIYQNKQCLISYEGNQRDTLLRIKGEISRIKNAKLEQPIKSVFNSYLTYIMNALPKSFNTIHWS